MQIEHFPDQQCFKTKTQSDQTAILSYELEGKNINFNHTFVPESFRGQGVAQQLVETGIGWAKTENLNISATCSYVQKWLSKS